MPTNKRRPEKDIIINFCRKRGKKKISLKHGGEKHAFGCCLLALDGARGAFKELKKNHLKRSSNELKKRWNKNQNTSRKSTFGAINFLFYELINNIEVYSVT